jgi:hypothetical protein
MPWFNHRSSDRILLLIIAAYLLVGGLYAVYTPAWQAPDEPAHYNYVRYLAERGHFPVLHYGDYPHAYLEQIKALRFPADMPIDPLRYEFWQPPLYYMLATPVYRLFGGSLLALRLLSVALGAGVILTAYAVVLSVRPGDGTLALGTCALVAFVPMHLTVMASVNNDTLAELLLALVLLLMIRLANHTTGAGKRVSGSTYLLATGLLLGLGLVTKATVYVAIPLALIALALSQYRPRVLHPSDLDGPDSAAVRAAGVHHRRYSGVLLLARQALVLFGPALLLAVPWYVRNVAVYGWPDWLGTLNHDAVVVGQLRTADYLASVGWATYVQNFLTTTFHSFWGQFGWMAVPMDARFYLVLGLLCVLMLAGCLVFVWRGREVARLGGQRRASDPEPHAYVEVASPATAPLSSGMLLLILWLILTSLMYLYYNLALVQFQGRYLFPALIPLACFGALGLREILSRTWSWVAAAVCGGVTLIIAMLSVFNGSVDKWGLLIAGLATLGFIVRRWLPDGLHGWLFAAAWAGLAGLSLYSLFFFVVPYLHP